MDNSPIWSYLRANHVLSLTAHVGEACWAANLFYAPASSNGVVYVMTSPDTQHGRLMRLNEWICGTISDQNPDVSTLQGIQYSGEIQLLEGAALATALAIYQERFPIARKHAEALWAIHFRKIKFTDNTAGFGTKYHWEKTGAG